MIAFICILLSVLGSPPNINKVINIPPSEFVGFWHCPDLDRIYNVRCRDSIVILTEYECAKQLDTNVIKTREGYWRGRVLQFPGDTTYTISVMGVYAVMRLYAPGYNNYGSLFKLKW